MEAERRLPFDRKAEVPRLVAFPVRRVLLPGAHQGDRVQKPQGRVLGRIAQHRLDFDPSGRPVPELDQCRHEVSADLDPGLVLGEERAIDLDLLFRLRARPEDGGLAEPSVEVVRALRDDLGERSIGVLGQPETQQGPADPDLGREEPGLQLRSVPVETQREGRNPPVEPGARPLHRAVEQLRARQQARTCRTGRSGGFAQQRLEPQLARQLGEPGALDEGTGALLDLGLDREREVAGRQHDEVRRSSVARLQDPTDRVERYLVRILEERVEETVAGAEHEPLGHRFRRVQALAHRLDESARELYERRARHEASENRAHYIHGSPRATAVNLAEVSGYLRALEREIRSSYRRERGRAAPTVRPYLDVNTEFTLRGGKRFRAILLLAGYHIATGRPPRPVLPAAAAMEHFQSWMLIHDDIIDHSEERRGGPTVHRSLTAEHRRERREGASEEYGMGIAITLGDLEEPFTVDGILGVRASPGARLAALAEYVRMTRLTAYGQLLDIRNGTLDPGSVTEADVLNVHRLKSAMYTVACPLRIGAILGGLGRAGLADLEAIGTDIGIAFQLRDDVLGAGFDAEESGKSSNDLAEGKRTLLVVRAWSAASDADRARLARVLGNAQATPEDVARAREVIRSTGSLDYSERRIAELTGSALRRLERSRALRASAKPLLREVADRLVRRKS